MAVSKGLCSTLSNVMFKQMPRSHWFLSINSQYLQPYWLLHQTFEHTKLQRYKATKMHTLTPLTYKKIAQQWSCVFWRTNEFRGFQELCTIPIQVQRSNKMWQEANNESLSFPVGLLAQFIRVLHQYHRGQAFFLQLHKLWPELYLLYIYLQCFFFYCETFR